MLEARPQRMPPAPRMGPAAAFRGSPLTFRIGALAIVAGLLLDLGAHVGPLASERLAAVAHWTVLLGMVVALAGVFVFAVRQRGG